MKPNMMTKLRSLGALVLKNTGGINSSYTARARVPLILVEDTARIYGDHPAERAANCAPTPMTIHLDIPAGTLLVVRVYSRVLPVIKKFIRGNPAPQIIGYETVNNTTLFKDGCASGNIKIFAGSPELNDSYSMPPIDVTLPELQVDSVLQVTLHSIPNTIDMVEVFAVQEMTLTPATTNDSHFTVTKPGWLTTQDDAQTPTIIDTINAQLLLQPVNTPGALNYVLITGTTWYDYLQEHLTFEKAKASVTLNPYGGNAMETGDTDDVIEGCLVMSGTYFFDPADASNTI